MHHDKRSSPLRWRAAANRPGLAVLASVLACGAGVAAAPAAQAAAAAGPAAANTSPALTGVSAISADDAWAVGFYQTFGQGNPGSPPIILRWNGTSWAKVHAPNPAGTNGRNQLTAVSADSANDAWAVGYYDTSYANVFPIDALILHWNGTSWTKVPSPNPGGTTGVTTLNGVHAVSANDVWAVGTYTEGTGGDSNVSLILHWNGTRWAQVASPNPAGLASTTSLSGVSAVSAKDVWAVGQYSAAPQDVPPIRSLVVHWRGSSWKQVTSPNPGGATGSTYVHGVSAVSANDAWAAGLYVTSPTGNVQPLLARWNGTSWKQVASPNPGGTTGSTYLEGVSADSAKDAWATGFYATTGNYRSLTLRWNGTSWTQVASPSPGGTTGSTELQGVSADSTKDAWAVGSYSTTCGNCASRSLILHWNGTTWKKVSSPS